MCSHMNLPWWACQSCSTITFESKSVKCQGQRQINATFKCRISWGPSELYISVYVARCLEAGDVNDRDPPAIYDREMAAEVPYAALCQSLNQWFTLGWAPVSCNDESIVQLRHAVPPLYCKLRRQYTAVHTAQKGPFPSTKISIWLAIFIYR